MDLNRNAVEYAKRCYESPEDGTLAAVPRTNKKFQASSAGRKIRGVEVRAPVWEWFVSPLSANPTKGSNTLKQLFECV